MTNNPFSPYGIIGCNRGHVFRTIWGVFQWEHDPGHHFFEFCWLQGASVSPEREINPWPGDVVLARPGSGLGGSKGGVKRHIEPTKQTKKLGKNGKLVQPS